MDTYTTKEPTELLNLFVRFHNKRDYISKYIEALLENKGYDIVICDNIYRLEPHITQDKVKMYEMPIEELLALHHKLIKKEGIPYIPNSLRKTLIRRTKDILINRGVVNVNNIDYRTKDFNIILTDTMSIGKEVHDSIFGEYNPEGMSETAYNIIWNIRKSRDFYNKQEKTVNLNKEKSMKNILIKFDNELLVKYVATELKNKLKLIQVAPKTSVPNGKYCGLLIKDNNIKEFRYNILDTGKTVVFTITRAANADTIIEEIVREYNKVETKTFNIGGAYNDYTIPVIVYPDQVSFNNEYMTFDKFIQLRNTLCASIGGFEIGGSSVLLLTHMNTNKKVYIQRDEFKPIIDVILGRLNG